MVYTTGVLHCVFSLCLPFMLSLGITDISGTLAGLIVVGVAADPGLAAICFVMYAFSTSLVYQFY